MTTSSLPSVSIITPSFNQAAFLEKTILSVLFQDVPSLEYMVVDGGSQDGSQEIIQRYANRLAWWVSEPDRGQGEAINKGMRRATGQIVAWLNSDDLYAPGAIRRALEVFQEHPEAGLVYGDVGSIDASGRMFNLMRFRQMELEDLMAFHIISQPGVFMRREALHAAGLLDTSYHFLLDHQLWLRIAAETPLVYTPQRLAYARFHPAAKNRAQAARFGEEISAIRAWMAAYPPLASRTRDHARAIEAGANWLEGYYLVEAGQPRQALAAYGRCFRGSPLRALTAWRRVLLACINLLGGTWLRRAYDGVRRRWLNRR